MSTLEPAFALASLTSGTMLATGAITAETNVPLGPALACFVFVAGLIWWLAQKLKAIDDAAEKAASSIAELAENQKTLIQNQRLFIDELREVKSDLSTRPCQRDGETGCPVK